MPKTEAGALPSKTAMHLTALHAAGDHPAVRQRHRLVAHQEGPPHRERAGPALDAAGGVRGFGA
jgi:hypothetical protein